MMVINVTQKNRTLDALLTYLTEEADRADRLARTAQGDHFETGYAAGHINQITRIKQWAHDHYGYSGNMPLTKR